MQGYEYSYKAKVCNLILILFLSKKEIAFLKFEIFPA